jgi:hypothetical protein
MLNLSLSFLFRAQLLMDRLARLVPRSTFTELLRSFLPLAFPSSAAAALLPGVWLHAPSDSARAQEEEVASELQSVAEEAYEGGSQQVSGHPRRE